MARKRQRSCSSDWDTDCFACEDCERSFRERTHLQQHCDATGHQEPATRSRRRRHVSKTKYTDTTRQHHTKPMSQPKLSQNTCGYALLNFATNPAGGDFSESSGFFEAVLLDNNAARECRDKAGLSALLQHSFENIERLAPELFCLWFAADGLPSVRSTSWQKTLSRQPPHKHLEFWQRKYMRAISGSFPSVARSNEFLSLPFTALTRLLERLDCRVSMRNEQLWVALERWAAYDATRHLELLDLLRLVPRPDHTTFGELPDSGKHSVQQAFPASAVEPADAHCALLAASMLAGTCSGNPGSTAADVVLVCAATGAQVGCHWELLCAFSPVFAAMREHICSESCTNQVMVQSTESALRWLVDWMLSGSADLLHNHIVAEVLGMAHFYDIQPLVEICCKRIQSLLHRWPELACNFWGVFQLLFDTKEYPDYDPPPMKSGNAPKGQSEGQSAQVHQDEIGAQQHQDEIGAQQHQDEIGAQQHQDEIGARRYLQGYQHGSVVQPREPVAHVVAVELCVQLLEQNFGEVSRSVGFLNLEFEQIKTLIESDKLCCNSECSVLLAVSQWVAHDCSARNRHADMLVPLIRFVYMSMKELVEAEEDVILSISPALRDSCWEAFRYKTMRHEIESNQKSKYYKSQLNPPNPRAYTVAPTYISSL